MSFQSLMVNRRQVVRALVFGWLLLVIAAASGPLAYGQFTLTVSSPLFPSAVDPGISAIATLGLAGSSGPVSFTCTVAPVQTTGTPVCSVSPASATPPALPSVTVTTVGTPAGFYAVTVTGTDGITPQSVALNLNVVDVVQNYTLSVSPTTAVPNPVTAGNSATTTVTVTPVASYSGSVTLACLSVSPVVTLPPVCSFNPPTVVVVANAVPPTSILTLITAGRAATGQRDRRLFYALWLLPGLALAGVGASGGRRKTALGALLLMAVGGGLLLMPACSAAKSTTTTVTPSTTYTITLTGADANGVGPGSTTAPTVSLTVN